MNANNQKQIIQNFVDKISKPLDTIDYHKGYSEVVENGFTLDYRVFVKNVRRIILENQMKVERERVRLSKTNVTHQ